jgi:Uma2 family endonuclease
MSAATEPQRLYTIEEWEALDEDDDRELVDGVLVESEMVDVVHESVVGRLHVWLDAYFHPRGGAAFASGLKYAISPRRGRIPDLSAFAELPVRRRGAQRKPADLLVEVISPTPADQRRDRIAKVADYASFGAPSYWIVDPTARVLEIYELHDGRYLRTGGGAEGVLEIAAFPGLSIDLDALWSEIDRLPDESEEP